MRPRWQSDWGDNSLTLFDPSGETFQVFSWSSRPGNVRQLLGRPGEVWGAESALDKLVVLQSN